MIFCAVMMAAVAGCSSNKTGSEPGDNELLKTEQSGAYTMRVQAVKKNPGDDGGLLMFRTRLRLQKEMFQQDKELAMKLQYGVDSAFYMVSGKDTVWPAYVMPVANGQALNPEFIVAFDPQGIDRNLSVQFKMNLEGVAQESMGVSFDTKSLKSLY
jgi:hypothetical protein